jgi:transposase
MIAGFFPGSSTRFGRSLSDCPAEYGPKKTLYNRFVRWADNGTWERIFHALAKHEDLPARLFIDATLIKAHRTAGGAKGLAHGIGRTQHGRQSKIHALCDERAGRGHSS